MIRLIFTAFIFLLLFLAAWRHFRPSHWQKKILNQNASDSIGLQLATLKEFYFQPETSRFPKDWFQAIESFCSQHSIPFHKEIFEKLLNERQILNLQKTEIGKKLQQDEALFLKEAMALDELTPPEFEEAQTSSDFVEALQRFYHPKSVEKAIENYLEKQHLEQNSQIKDLIQEFNILQESISKSGIQADELLALRKKQDLWYENLAKQLQSKSS